MRRGHGSDVFAYRVADGFHIDIGIKTAREGLQHNPGKTRQKTVGHACCGILLVNNQGTPRQPGGDTTRTTDETSHAEHSSRTVTNNDGERLHQRPANL